MSSRTQIVQVSQMALTLPAMEQAHSMCRPQTPVTAHGMCLLLSQSECHSADTTRLTCRDSIAGLFWSSARAADYVGADAGRRVVSSITN